MALHRRTVLQLALKEKGSTCSLCLLDCVSGSRKKIRGTKYENLKIPVENMPNNFMKTFGIILMILIPRGRGFNASLVDGAEESVEQ